MFHSGKLGQLATEPTSKRLLTRSHTSEIITETRGGIVVGTNKAVVRLDMSIPAQLLQRRRLHTQPLPSQASYGPTG
jgi:hypothetical protein